MARKLKNGSWTYRVWSPSQQQWIRKRGKKPGPKRKYIKPSTLLVRLPLTLIAAMEEHCEQEGIDRHAFVGTLIRKEMKASVDLVGGPLTPEDYAAMEAEDVAEAAFEAMPGDE